MVAQAVNKMVKATGKSRVPLGRDAILGFMCAVRRELWGEVSIVRLQHFNCVGCV
jgi:hypothetical protein